MKAPAVVRKTSQFDPESISYVFPTRVGAGKLEIRGKGVGAGKSSIRSRLKKVASGSYISSDSKNPYYANFHWGQVPPTKSGIKSIIHLSLFRRPSSPPPKELTAALTQGFSTESLFTAIDKVVKATEDVVVVECSGIVASDSFKPPSVVASPVEVNGMTMTLTGAEFSQTEPGKFGLQLVRWFDRKPDGTVSVIIRYFCKASSLAEEEPWKSAVQQCQIYLNAIAK